MGFDNDKFSSIECLGTESQGSEGKGRCLEEESIDAQKDGQTDEGLQ